ncbi:MAG TPA: hypothetical protein VD886_03190 [Herpetosiphonaceae bacterium]|nr:hypothetical protein [Herpetosiphonaceae bacterium]
MRHQLHRIDPDRFKTDLRTLIKLCLPIVALVAFLVAASIYDQLNIGIFTRDPATLTNSNPFLGVLSSVGILFWCATAAICFFGFAMLRSSASDRIAPRFLLDAGLITALLMLDDLFLFHEYVFPQFLHFGEKVALLGYGAIVAGFLWRYRQRILGSDYLLLALAFGLFGFSVMADNLFNTASGNWGYLLEDGPKLFGIIVWFTYWSGVCAQLLRPRREG